MSPTNRDPAPLRYPRYPGFEALPSDFSSLFDQHASRSFCLSLPWFRNFVATVKEPGTEPVIFAVESPGHGNHPLAALPMLRTTATTDLGAPRVLRPLANYYSSLFEPMLDAADHNQEWLLRHLIRSIQAAGTWDMLEFSPLDQSAPLFAALNRALRADGWVTQTYFVFGNWYLEVEGRTYGEYLAALPSVLRKNIPYYERKIERTFRARYVIVDSNDGLDEALAAYDRVYRSSWKQPEPHPEFIPGLARTAVQAGWLRLGVAYLDDTPAAAQFWIVNQGIASIFKVSYDPGFAKSSVGTVLTAKLMQRVIDIDGVHTVDFLSGDDPYKQGWMSHRRERWGIVAMNPKTFRGALAIVRHIGGRAIKRAIGKVSARTTAAA